MPRALTTTLFIQRARQVHGDRYDYSKVDYVSRNKHVIIICKTHGGFSQNPGNHINSKSNCPKCAQDNTTLRNRASSVTYLSFTTRANKIHNGKYQYPKNCPTYKNSKSKVPIRCPKHNNDFIQSAASHLRGHGCPKCRSDLISLIRLSRTFVTQAKEKFGDYFNYDNVKYLGNATKVEIICPEHGSFRQRPDTHLNSSTGCPKHSVASSASQRRITENQFIERAEKVHSGKYSYEQLKWEDITTTKQKVQIKCPTHGFFMQIGDSHLCGSGCPRCVKHSSTIALAWLEECAVRDETYIETSQNGGERRILNYLVDGFSEELNKAYEFHGEQNDISMITAC